ncbi:MAG: hypothetical protein WC758_00135 [Candidatus Woesearchaeota archaeon]
MNNDDIFWGLVNFQVNYNLPTWLNIIDDHSNWIELIDGIPTNVPRRVITDSKNENKGEYSFKTDDGQIHSRKIVGAFIVLDQRKFKPMTTHIVNNAAKQTTQVNSFSDIEQIIINSENQDGGYILTNNGTDLKKVQSFNNERLSVKEIQKLLPKDFFSYTKDIHLLGTDGTLNLGNRSSTALSLAIKHSDIDSFLIKQTSYTDFGLGKIVHFDKKGLDEEFFLTTNPPTGLGYAQYEKSIKGVYKNYRLNSKGQLSRITITLDLNHGPQGYFVNPEDYKKAYIERLGNKQRKLLNLTL